MSHVAPEIRTSILCVFAALAVASGIALAASWWYPDRDFHQPRSRIRTWWVIAGLFAFSLAWSLTAAIVFLAFVSYLSLKEFFSMTPTRRADRRVLFYAYLSVPIQYYFAASGSFGMFLVFIPVLMFVWLPTRMWLIGQTEGFLRAAGTMHWGLMLTVFSLSHAALLLVFQPGESTLVAPAHPSSIAAAFPGTGLLFFLVLMTELNDIFQRLWGQSLRGSRVAPTVSREKTYSGLIGGVVGTLAGSVIVGPAITLLDVPRALIAGVLISFAGFAGDLCMSALKRDLKISNFGATLPGHGGVLDRVDSLIFTAPLFFHFVNYCYG